jgi:dUTP pyrophosphatase
VKSLSIVSVSLGRKTSFFEVMHTTLTVATAQAGRERVRVMAVLDHQTILNLIARKGLVTGLVDEVTQVTPNGVELSLQKVYRFREAGAVDFDNRKRRIPEYEEIAPTDDRYSLPPGSYLVTYNETLRLPTDIVAIGRPRSSLLRSGATIESAVWDAGYEGRSRGLLTVSNPYGFVVTKNARLLHLIFIQLKRKTKPYKGAYQGET